MDAENLCNGDPRLHVLPHHPRRRREQRDERRSRGWGISKASDIPLSGPFRFRPRQRFFARFVELFAPFVGLVFLAPVVVKPRDALRDFG